jgi:hypothetical protein
MRSWRQYALAAVVFGVLQVSFSVQGLLAQGCNGDGLVGADKLTDFLFRSQTQHTQAEMKPSLLQESVNQPLTAPASQQITAPATRPGATALVNGASFAQLIAGVIENDLAKVSDGVTTLDLNVFAFKALISPHVLDKQSEYEQYEGLRRWGGTLSSGGKGESFDRNGDGVADSALSSKNPADIVSWELHYQFGSRNRRDRKNVEKLFGRADPVLDEIGKRFAEFNSTHREELLKARSESNPQCFDQKKLQKVVEAHADELKKIKDLDGQLQQVMKDTNDEIDGSQILTLAGGGLDRRKDFGPTKRTLSLRYAKGGADKGFTGNLDYTHVQDFNDAPAQQSWKLGLDYSILVFRDRTADKNGVKLSISAADELYRNVPSATHDSIIKVNAKVDFPVTKGVKVPLSITWANHKDLLSSEHDVSGHIGFSIDLSSMKEPKM